MAIDTYIVGNDGNVSYSINSTTQTLLKVQSYAANISRPVTDLTAFGDTGRRKRLGMMDLTGTLNCIVGIDSAASTTTTNSAIVFSSQQDGTTGRPTVTLTLYDGASAADATITAKCVFSSFSFNSAKAGDTTCTVNFENADGVAPVVSWLV